MHGNARTQVRALLCKIKSRLTLEKLAWYSTIICKPESSYRRRNTSPPAPGAGGGGGVGGEQRDNLANKRGAELRHVKWLFPVSTNCGLRTEAQLNLDRLFENSTYSEIDIEL